MEVPYSTKSEGRPLWSSPLYREHHSAFNGRSSITFKAGQVDTQLRHDITRGVLNELYRLIVIVENINVDAQALQLLHQHFEGHGNPWLDHILALHDGLVGLHTPHVVV